MIIDLKVLFLMFFDLNIFRPLWPSSEFWTEILILSREIFFPFILRWKAEEIQLSSKDFFQQ